MTDCMNRILSQKNGFTNSQSRVRCYASYIMQSPRFLTVDKQRVGTIARAIGLESLRIPRWDLDGVYVQSDTIEEVSRFFLIFNSINFSYFHETPQLEGQRFTDGELYGARLAAVRITQHWDELQDPEFLSKVTENYLSMQLFASKVPIPLLKQRVTCLREVGRFLTDLEKTNQTLRDFLSQLRGDAYQVAEKIPQVMPSWSDPFLKRSQLFVAMLYGRFQDSPDCPIKQQSLQKLTIFADYRIPQTLIAMGIVRPKPQLESVLANGVPIKKNSRPELEIRAASVFAADQIMQQVNHQRPPDRHINALHVDHLLWKTSRDKEKTDNSRGILQRPFPKHHRTVTTSY